MESKVIFRDEKLKESFEKLEEYDPDLHSQLQKARDEISRNVFCGRNVKKKLIPKEYIQKYFLDNLWIYNLRSGWRLFYTITRDEKIEILSIVLDWMNHKDYERLFGF